MLFCVEFRFCGVMRLDVESWGRRGPTQQPLSSLAPHPTHHTHKHTYSYYINIYVDDRTNPKKNGGAYRTVNQTRVGS